MLGVPGGGVVTRTGGVSLLKKLSWSGVLAWWPVIQSVATGYQA